jgi:hypothetical protein
LSAIQTPFNLANTLLVRSSCSQPMTHPPIVDIACAKIEPGQEDARFFQRARPVS